MAAEGRKQVMITVSLKLLERVDAYCEENGISRTAFFTTAAADKLSQYDMSKDAVSQLVAMLGTSEGLAALANATEGK